MWFVWYYFDVLNQQKPKRQPRQCRFRSNLADLEACEIFNYSVEERLFDPKFDGQDGASFIEALQPDGKFINRKWFPSYYSRRFVQEDSWPIELLIILLQILFWIVSLHEAWPGLLYFEIQTLMECGKNTNCLLNIRTTVKLSQENVCARMVSE